MLPPYDEEWRYQAYFTALQRTNNPQTPISNTRCSHDSSLELVLFVDIHFTYYMLSDGLMNNILTSGSDDTDFLVFMWRSRNPNLAFIILSR